ncbi:hypothetical protein HF519_24740 [Pseudonocardia bannensis]|uniref:Uncharacterized protein n=1 Tax=Pseudonocardia bannensis TaxID=630973 RepID=A0A848DPL2_9PSEU|nr:hypothetical protein [Pseudonocardia bannensis]
MIATGATRLAGAGLTLRVEFGATGHAVVRAGELVDRADAAMDGPTA